MSSLTLGATVVALVTVPGQGKSLLKSKVAPSDSRASSSTLKTSVLHDTALVSWGKPVYTHEKVEM